MTNSKQSIPETIGNQEIDGDSCLANESPHVLREDDGRDRYDYKSKYEDEAKVEIRLEAAFLFALLFVSVLLLYLTWNNAVPSLLGLEDKKIAIAKKYIYYLSSGMLGGTVFGMKYFYRVVARGWWHQDRRAWRVISPFISGIVGLMVGVFIDASLLKSPEITSPSIVSIGFLAGYFADEAVGKMYEIANVIFGTNNSPRKG